MKYFNYKFLKENLKQGKGIILFFLMILPFANIVSLFIHNLNHKYIISFANLSLLTYIGMFIIPLVIAYVLFGFIFKKKSVDFYLSQPINRKSIYITNLIGGICLITFTLIINVLIFKIFGVFTNISMPMSLITDYFIYFLVSYIFFYLLYILGFSLSGNLWTSLVVSLLLLCFVPFLRVVNNYFINLNNVYLVCPNGSLNCDNNIISADRAINEHSFVTPISFLFNSIYRNIDVIHTAIFALIYLFLSYYIFNKRKMENNESSFKNPRIHFLVKTLTVIPLCFIVYLCLTESTFDETLILIVLSFVYYIIYDLITRRSIYKFPLTLFVFIVTLGISLGIFTGYKKFSNKDIILNNVTEIKTERYDIKNKDVINKILQDEIDYKYYDYTNYTHMYATITNDNIKYTAILPIKGTLLASLDEYLLPEAFDIAESDYASLYYNESFPITDNFRNMLKDYQPGNNVYDISYDLYKYVNHDYQKISIIVNEESLLTDYTMKILNSDFIKEYKNDNNIYNYIDILGFNDEDLANSYGLLRYILNANKQEFIKYLEEHQNDKITKDYIKIMSNNRCYFISDIASFKELFNKFKENVQNDTEYQRLLKENNEYYK